MAHAYTPGLKVAVRTPIRRERRLPLRGQVLVEQGQQVSADAIVARSELPGAVHSLSVANQLNIDAADLEDAMLFGPGAAIEKDQVIARGGGFFGLLKTEIKAPVKGTIESVSRMTGQVLLRGIPVPVEVEAYMDGQVASVLPEEGVIVATEGSLVQGIFGIGPETRGPIKIVGNSAKNNLDVAQLDASVRGAIVVGGARLTLDAIKMAIKLEAAAVVAGGLGYEDLSELLGYSIGVAVTGQESVGITLVITEGFGSIPMAERTWELLKSHEGRMASVNGATQIRAGVIRPEIVIPGEAVGVETASEAEEALGVDVGSRVRIIREPYFGRIGTVAELPPEPQPLATEALVRVVDIHLEDGRRVTVPRANIEHLQD